MPISFTKYVDITSGVGGATAVRQRDLIGRIFTTNPLVPTKTVVEFDTLEDVGTYFGTSSNEYLRARFYFGWISKNITRPRKLSFGRWADAATAPQIFGKTASYALGQFTSITNGAFSLTLGGVTNVLTSIDFSGAASLAAVAAVLQAKIRTQSGAQWTSATVVYNASRGSFDFTGGATGAANVVVANAGSGTEIANTIGWLTGAILSNGVAVETITTLLTESAEISNNFGSFLFMPTLTLDQITEAATWNDGQNVRYIYTVAVLAINAATWSAALLGLAGVALTLSATSGEYPEQVPMMILAATDYNRQNSVQNYMFQIFTLTPSVTTTTDSNTYDALRVNYYGRTQTAGQLLDFYQRGVLMGNTTDPVDMNVYANEIWLKDAAAASIMALLLALARVPANDQGRTRLISTLQGVVNRALINGTISVGKALTDTQKEFIDEQTGSPTAWRQIQNIGYWLDCVIESYTTQDDRTEYKAVYSLVYSKDDAIRKVEGTHTLI
jgi:hypothetical protein